MTQTTTFTREYKSADVARRDIQQQAKRGYEVVSMTSVPQSAGIMRWLTLGFASLVFKPKPHVLVVYKLSAQGVGQYMTQIAPTPPVDEPMEMGSLYLTPAENMALAKANFARSTAQVKSAFNTVKRLFTRNK